MRIDCRGKAKKWDICPDILVTFVVQLYIICHSRLYGDGENQVFDINISSRKK